MRLAANESCRKGRLIRLAMATEPSKVASKAMPVQMAQVLLLRALPWLASACSQ